MFKNEHKPHPSKRVMRAKTYDIVPTVAFAQSVQVYSLAASLGMRYVFTGGADGFVRKYDFESSLNNKQPMSVSQRHAHTDSITKGAVLDGYWENEQPLFKDKYKVESDQTYKPEVSPVFSLQVQSEALWVVAGLQSGGISFQSAFYGHMGETISYLNGHTKPVSDMHLNDSETLLLSGGWDKRVNIWDLNRGVSVQSYSNMSSQLSTVAWQPIGGPRIVNAPSSDSDSDKSMESLFGSDEEDDEVKDESGNAGGNDNGGNNNDGSAQSVNTGQVFLTSTFNGLVEIWDSRQQERCSWLANSQSPPWCMSACWSYSGDKIYSGRRNNLVEEYDIRNCKEPSKLLKFPALSGQVSCVTPLPNGTSIMCACQDNIRVYDLTSTRKTPFIIIPGHHGSIISRMLVDSAGKYMVSVCGGRGWMDAPVDVGLGYEIEPEIPDEIAEED